MSLYIFFKLVLYSDVFVNKLLYNLCIFLPFRYFPHREKCCEFVTQNLPLSEA